MLRLAGNMQMSLFLGPGRSFTLLAGAFLGAAGKDSCIPLRLSVL